MGMLIIDGHVLRKAIIAGANELNKNKEVINALNVFPVPDGDTGINMSMTVIAAAKEVERLNTPNIYDIAKAASSGSLRGARGNSGVILSQIFRGFAKGLENKTTANAEDISEAFSKAVETAYKAVMKPKEGTILTVAKSISESAFFYNFDNCNNGIDIKAMLKEVIKEANKTLEQTQHMLPELKQAGVIDAGGKGLLCILEGALNSSDLDYDIKLNEDITNNNTNNKLELYEIADVDIKFTYCTEFFINVENVEMVDENIEEEIKYYLSKKGDSIVVVVDENIIKIHVHTNHPGEVLEKALKFGEISNIKIENMKIQHTNIISFVEEIKDQEKSKNTGFVCVSSGKGLNEIFKKLGIDQIIEGGQTMNPSTDDILNAIKKVNAENIVILPNNSNIILAANQAAQLCNDKNVCVIPTKSIAEGIAAIISSLEDINLEENLKNMIDAINNVQTGQVTYAVRDTILENLEIKENDIICMLDNKICDVSSSIEEGTKKLIDKMIYRNENAEIVSIYYGNGIDEKDVLILKDYIKTKYSDIEVEIYNGGQPLYYYIISVE